MMRCKCPIAVLAVLSGLLAAAPGAASDPKPRACSGSKPHGITTLTAVRVDCRTALKVAVNHNFRMRTTGWACRGKRISSTRERVTCRKGSRRIAFRSTYVIEVPPAVAPPVANPGS
jgi:hypothetical protein